MFTVYITSDNLVKVRHHWTTYSDECGQDYVVQIRRINLHLYDKRSSGLESKGLVVGFFFFFNFNPFPLLFRTRGDKRQRKRRGKDHYNTGTTGPWPGEEGGGGQAGKF